MAINYSSSDEKRFWESSASEFLPGIMRGIEKESLRISPDGYISQRRHPPELGSTLTNQYITTDYSEALLEFITPASDGLTDAIDWLMDIHQFVYQHLGDELLWATSMPCVMGRESDIPLAYYGESNSGKMKTVYREGLGHRYGRFMQTIAGVHYNLSFTDAIWKPLKDLEPAENSDLQDYKSSRYMGVIRNFQRHSWVIPYLFGASPAICESFLHGRPSNLETLVPGTRYGKFATSLRMSDLGYQNNVQSRLKVSTNYLKQYIADLEHAIRTEDPYYRSIGVKEDGKYRQLNANVLQIENEFYSNIRPKRNSRSGERPTKALAKRGIEYIEVRALDINPFSPVGVSQEQLYFLDIFMLYCLMESSGLITEREEAETKKNFALVVKKGRDPDLHLLRNNQQVSIKVLAQELFDNFNTPAELLDKAYSTTVFSQTLAKLSSVIEDPESSLSGKIIAEVTASGQGFFPYALELSNKYKSYFNQLDTTSSNESLLKEEAKRSIQAQKAIEHDDELTFEEFVAKYFA
ncbi:glutamate--cysteine ligase [Pleionea sediminis]|uniref:glutamate--cysteine ligase n=1 Tax=Pleionea sediminis TaxID=2569479 RepID=UPI001184A443|nr:glutamate--cysteine ligase [Pleionea sediminis]